jgi:diaminohydroxyphosphoribosylaminopyrimidine deaminase/5-amino-6-(5-phosphoribosylamino)uracil reductase
MDESDARYLERALDLAENGRGRTSPNPVVGAVIVKDGDVVGEGWHVAPGRDHAEIAAMKDALRRHGAQLPEEPSPLPEEETRAICEGATMFVTLEPCCTQGRTPPCTSSLIGARFARVVAAAVDPSPGVNGNGLAALRAAGVEVELAEGPSAHRAKRQNDALRKSVSTGLPFVTYKYAMSVDGRVASDSGDSRWISSAESRAVVHQWRAWSDAVVVGAGTVASDDPLLTARDVDCARQPLRVVIDRDLSLSRESNLVRTIDQAPVLALCGLDAQSARRREVESWGVETESVPIDASGEVHPTRACAVLKARGVQAVLLEGGPKLAGAWWAAGLIDKVAAFVSPRVVSGTLLKSALLGPGATAIHEGFELLEVAVQHIGSDVLISGYTGGPF